MTFGPKWVIDFLKKRFLLQRSLFENYAGGAPAQSCEGRTGPSLHPPHPWPTPPFSCHFTLFVKLTSFPATGFFYFNYCKTKKVSGFRNLFRL